MKKTGKCNECSIQWAHVLDEASPDGLRANQNGETRHLRKGRLRSPKHHWFPGFLSLPSLESFASFPQFWEVAVTVPLSPDTLRSQSGWVKVDDLETRASKKTLNGQDWDHVGCALKFLKLSNSWCKLSQYLVPGHPLPWGLSCAL